jgi:hypothetical protein
MTIEELGWRLVKIVCYWIVLVAELTGIIQPML